MSQRTVEAVIGRLVTDEGLRRRFAVDAERTLGEIIARGHELTAVEMNALVAIDPRLLETFADSLDPRIQKADCCGGAA